MKLTLKFFLFFIGSSLIYFKLYNLNLLEFVILELFTLGFAFILLTIYEAFFIKNCEKEYKQYKLRQKLVVNKQ